MKIKELLENTSSGATGSSSIATVSVPLGNTIKRLPNEQSFFGVEFPKSPKIKKKRPKQS